MAFVDSFEPDHRILFKPLDNCETEGCHVDVWLPKVKPKGCPVAIFIHGGGFTIGSTKDIPFSQVAWYLEQGLVCCSVEYRLAPQGTISHIREDLLDAYIFVQTKLQDHLDVELDFSKCLITGGSAGGSSTLLMAGEVEEYSKTHPINKPRALLVAYPICDYVLPPANDKPRSVLVDEYKEKDEWKLLGPFLDGPVCVSQPYPPDVFNQDVTNPRLLFSMLTFKTETLNSWVLGSDTPYPPSGDVLKGIGASTPPTVIWAALKDSLISVEQSFLLQRHLEASGVEVKLFKVDAEHGFEDLPGKYFPKEAQGWWYDYILPGMKWALEKMEHNL